MDIETIELMDVEHFTQVLAHSKRPQNISYSLDYEYFIINNYWMVK